MKNWLRNLIARHLPLRYEVIGINESLDPWIVWCGKGSLGVVSGFYMTEERARRAAKECPEGYVLYLYEIPRDAYVKREIPL